MDLKRDILVAEDNPALAAVLRFNLQQAGYEVSVAKNGREALQLAGSQKFDFIITDHQMPMMSGIEFCDELRKHDWYSETPIIMLTAKALELKSEYVLREIKAIAMVSKPFSPSALVQTVDQHFSATSCEK